MVKDWVARQGVLTAALGAGADESLVSKTAEAAYRALRRGESVAIDASGAGAALARELAAAMDLLGVCAELVDHPARDDDLEWSRLAQRHAVIYVSGPPMGWSAPDPAAAGPGRPLKLAFAGAGVVNGGVIELTAANGDVASAVGVLVRDPSKYQSFAEHAPLITDPDALLASGPDVLVEAMGGEEPALTLFRRALKAGVNVVTANKQVVAAHMTELQALAHESGARLCYSASVGGGAPFVETARRARAIGGVAEIEGTLNGTVNFMLSRIAVGDTYEAALKTAQERGYAEADPSDDVLGRDAGAKITILAYEAFGRLPAELDISRGALTPETAAELKRAGGVWRQIGRAWTEGGEARAEVILRQVSGDHLYLVPAWSGDADGQVWNNLAGLRATLGGGASLRAQGRGAGREPTAMSMWSDIVDLWESM